MRNRKDPEFPIYELYNRRQRLQFMCNNRKRDEGCKRHPHLTAVLARKLSDKVSLYVSLDGNNHFIVINYKGSFYVFEKNRRILNITESDTLKNIDDYSMLDVYHYYNELSDKVKAKEV